MKQYLLLMMVLFNLNLSIQAENKFPKVYLNHVYVVVDDITFKGIVKSTFYNKKFANVDIGSPAFKPVNENCTSLYIRGKSTYVEVYNTKNPYGLKEGQVGVGFSVEQKNGAKQIYDSLSLKNAGMSFSLDSLSVNGQPTCAAEYKVKFNHPDSLALFNYMLTEYHPDLMQGLYKQNFKSKPVKRSDFLKKRYSTDKLLNDITEINLQLLQKEALPFIELLKQTGFKVSEKNSTYIAKGNDIIIRVKTADEQMPKLDMQFKMNGTKDGNYNLNNVKLNFDGSYGTWSFY